MAPYRIEKEGDAWVVKHKKSGKWLIKARHTSRAKAVAQMRLLYGIEAGWKPTGRKSKLDKELS